MTVDGSIYHIVSVLHILILLPFSKEGEILKTEKGKQEIGMPKKKGLGGTMGGKVLKLKIDKMLEDSETRGIAKGEKNKEYVCFANCLNRGYSFEDAKVLSGATDEAANEHYERWLQEKKDI